MTFVIEEIPRKGWRDGRFWTGKGWTRKKYEALAFPSEDAAFAKLGELERTGMSDRLVVRSFAERLVVKSGARLPKRGI